MVPLGAILTPLVGSENADKGVRLVDEVDEDVELKVVDDGPELLPVDPGEGSVSVLLELRTGIPEGGTVVCWLPVPTDGESEF